MTPPLRGSSRSRAVCAKADAWGVNSERGIAFRCHPRRRSANAPSQVASNTHSSIVFDPPPARLRASPLPCRQSLIFQSGLTLKGRVITSLPFESRTRNDGNFAEGGGLRKKKSLTEVYNSLSKIDLVRLVGLREWPLLDLDGPGSRFEKFDAVSLVHENQIAGR